MHNTVFIIKIKKVLKLEKGIILLVEDDGDIREVSGLLLKVRAMRYMRRSLVIGRWSL